MKFFIVSTGYNCSKYVHKAYYAMVNQTYKNFKAIIIDDGSTDDTNEMLSLVDSDKRIQAYSTTTNMGAAYRRWQAINELSKVDKETIIVLVGLDDELKPNALKTIAEQYKKGVWMTYGNWIDSTGRVYPADQLYYEDSIHEARRYRKERYRSTGLNTFKKFLFDKIPKKDYMVDGEWVRSTTESHLMFSCLEMCGRQKIGVIEKPIVIYNRRTDSAAARYGREYQDSIFHHVVSMKPKKKYERK